MKEIKFNDLSLGLQLIIVFSFVIAILIVGLGIYANFYEAEDEPRNAYWKCHNETISGIVNESDAYIHTYPGLDVVVNWKSVYLKETEVEGYFLSGMQLVDELKCVYEEGLCYYEYIEEICEIK